MKQKIVRDPVSSAVLTSDLTALEAYKSQRTSRVATQLMAEHINSIMARLTVLEAKVQELQKG